MEETVLEKLHEDHATLMGLFEAVEQASNGTERKEKFLPLRTLLIQHMTAEEVTIYRRLGEDVPEQRARILKLSSENEHHQIKECLQKLNLLSVQDKTWMNLICELKKIVKQHCETEEGQLFKEIKEDFSREELEELTFEYLQARA